MNVVDQTENWFNRLLSSDFLGITWTLFSMKYSTGLCLDLLR